ncbi:hypothetical protein GCM10007916_25560 [Psychromonas marina]|uniref:diguanylate cyclase n=1 Tax=Psychromonas marina TaxID=88364 RepID=A0ABQ6E284_9GAMM|nr:diguanylate cyclase [Psychromonas marina]GLS91487.1 hypothetical protein GCM10007916_25560 [Psychromonas marina]
MEEYNQIECNIDDNSVELNDHISDISRYKNKNVTEKSAFQEVMSQIDISDRHAFDHQYKQLWCKGAVQGSCLSVFICEIDFFEAYRENYGEQSASFMLLVVAVALKGVCERNNCFLAHYENASFAILMIDANDLNAADIAEQLRQAVEQTGTEHKYSSVSDVVTLSIGVSSNYPISMQTLFDKTNAILKVSKSNGRNKVSTDLSDSSVAITSQKVVPSLRETHSTSKISTHIPLKQSMLAINVNGRRTFQHDFTKLWQQSLDEGELISLLICKVDFFSDYVECYGEQSGENLLLTVANTLNHLYKNIGGAVYHAGGQKFIALFKGSNATTGLRVANALHELIASSSIEHKTSSISDFITISAGLSCLIPDKSNSMKILMNQVDIALNKAVQDGRNQTSVS